MRHTWLALLLALLPLGAAAQDAPASTDTVVAELAKVNATLKEIAALMNRQSDMQSLDLLLKRVQLSDSQVAELERRLRSAESELRDLESQRGSTEMQLTMLTARLEKGQEPSGELKAMSTQTEEALKRIKQRMGQLTQEIVSLEGDLATRRDELRSWQSILDRRLARHTG